MKNVIIWGAVIALCVACGNVDEGDGAVFILRGGAEPDCGPGNLVVFSDGYDLYWCDEHGRNVKSITSSPYTTEFDPTWSPDGAWVAYCARNPNTKKAGIYAVPKAWGTPIQLTDDNGRRPAWSPDGKTIAYLGGETLNVYLVPATGGESERLTKQGHCTSVCWSTEGDFIFFSGADRKNPAGPYSLWSVPAAGGNVTRLWEAEGYIGDISLAPGGEWLAVVPESARSPNDVWLFHVKGGRGYRLTREAGYVDEDSGWHSGASSPTWTEDGDRVIFYSDRQFDAGIYGISVKR